MKKIVSAIALCAAASTFAADAVYSANIVGFQKVTVEAGKFVMLGVNFESDKETPVVGDVVGNENIPDGTILYKWNGIGYETETFLDGYGWYPGTNVLNRGEGFWFSAPTDFELTFSGNVSVEPTAVSAKEGYQMISYPYPVDMTASNTVMGVSLSDGDIAYTFDGDQYTDYAYLEGYGWYPELKLKAGEAFWFKSVKDVEWTESVPFVVE